MSDERETLLPPPDLLQRPIRIRGAIEALERRLAYLIEYEPKLTPNVGTHLYVVNEIRALTLALTLLHHEATLRKGEEPRAMKQYAINFVPFAER